MILVTYTTEYRDGGAHLQQAARTLARERASAGEVRLVATESKRAFVDAVTRSGELHELHFVGHSGMYGPMFGTTSMPEQLSPHEWRELKIPLAESAQAWFHCCRSGRWFAPFFARTFGVPTWGHHWYTTLSRSPSTYRWVPAAWPEQQSLYVVGQRGRRSHGLLGSLGKHSGLLPPTPMVCHAPRPGLGGPAYDRVARLYDRVFEDIRVRGPEWRWLVERVPRGSRVLDIGCGTGALLRALDERGVEGLGVDASPEMLACARERAPHHRWEVVDGPRLPAADNSVDICVSLLSWRYLDWDPMLAEVARVLRPGGRLLVVDMAATPASLRDLPRVAVHKARAAAHLRRFPGVRDARDRLVQEPAWQEMLAYNPIRGEHEYRWFFESRFPQGKLEVLDVGRKTRVVAFDSGPITQTWFPPQSYP